MAKTNNLTDFLTSEANKFRSVLGTQGTIDPQDFDDLIDDVYDKGYADKPGTDVSDTTATAPDVLSGEDFYLANGTKTQGSMTNNGTVTGTIATKTGSYAIPEGYHNGNGSVSIDSTEQAKILADNIKAGISILGVEGSFSNVTQVVYGTVTPSSNTRTLTFDPLVLNNNPKFIAILCADMALSADNTRYIVCYIYSNVARISGAYSQAGCATFGKSSSPYGSQVYRYPGNTYWEIDRTLSKFADGTAYVKFNGTTAAYFKSGVGYTYIIGA